MAYNPARALGLLQLGTQTPAATFHDGQEAARRIAKLGLNATELPKVDAEVEEITEGEEL